MSKTLSQIIGKIKRKYTNEDFNPFAAMSYVYDHCLAAGAGSLVTIVGYSDRYRNEMQRAWLHVMADRGLISGNVPPQTDPDGYFETHTGARIRFMGMLDTEANQTVLDDICQHSGTVVLCNEYNHPNLRSLIRSYCDSVSIYDVSKNNLKESVDS